MTELCTTWTIPADHVLQYTQLFRDPLTCFNTSNVTRASDTETRNADMLEKPSFGEDGSDSRGRQDLVEKGQIILTNNQNRDIYKRLTSQR
jgi:hypothetical protein